MKALSTFLTLLLCSFGVIFAQGMSGEIKGTITDAYNGNPIEMAVVKIQAGVNTLGGFTDEKGQFSISGVPVGKYMLDISAVGYLKLNIEDVRVSDGSITFVDRALELREGKMFEYVFEKWKDDLLGKGTPGTMKRIDAEQIAQDATLRDVGTIIGTSVPKVYMKDDGDPLNFSGSRQGATLYMIDGVKVIGDPQIPNRGIGEIVVITGGLPAKYGDTTSGVVLINTKSF